MRRTALVLAGLMALAVLVPSPAAVGQVMGLYYQEVEKDGRIYIFNTPEKYNAFQQSGDMGIAVTLIGRGANGETLVGENETAIDLYLFRHNLPAYERPTPKAPAPPDPNAWYNKIKVSGYVFGDGYYIHGTLYRRLLGESITHGCVRVADEDLQPIFEKAKVGTPVYIF